MRAASVLALGALVVPIDPVNAGQTVSSARSLSSAGSSAGSSAAWSPEWSSGGSPAVRWSASQKLLVAGRPFVARVEIDAPEDGATLPTWMLEPAGFTIDGKPVEERRGNQTIHLLGGAKIALELDLGPALEASKAFEKRKFKLGYAKERTSGPDLEVAFMRPVARGVDFARLPAEELAQHHVLLVTNQGSMELELWPDVAPRHVANFLDLAASGFYDGTLFFRVGPGFMIQGGDPETKTDNTASWSQGRGPRTLAAEFNARRHERGVLSMARGGNDPDSASCQFFVMHGNAPALDGQYTAFGKLVDGFDALDAIANAKGTVIDDQTFRPREPQRLISATVIVAPDAKSGSAAAKAGGKGSK